MRKKIAFFPDNRNHSRYWKMRHKVYNIPHVWLALFSPVYTKHLWALLPMCVAPNYRAYRQKGKRESIPYGLIRFGYFAHAQKDCHSGSLFIFFLLVCYHFPIRNPLKKHIRALFLKSSKLVVNSV